MAFRRFSRRHRKFGKTRVSSMDNLLEEREPRRVMRDRAKTIDALDLSGSALSRRLAWADTTNICKDSNKLTEEWMEEWQVPLVLPFGKSEFKRRVEAVKSAVMIEMDAESARDMRNYSLARRRKATCKVMLTTQIEKAASTLGILGLKRRPVNGAVTAVNT